jgi:hypothetical protein
MRTKRKISAPKIKGKSRASEATRTEERRPARRLAGPPRSGVPSRTQPEVTQPTPAIYEPTERDREIVDAHYAVRMENPSPSVKIAANGDISFDHPDPGLANILTMNSMGTTSPAFLLGLIKQLLPMSCELTEADLNYGMATIKGMKPQDHIEAMLAQQMFAIHTVTMRSAARVAHAETAEARQTAINDLNRCARTYASQVDAWKRYRSTGEQTVKVQHVVVNEGGQAIVGNVQHGGGGDGERFGG